MLQKLKNQVRLYLGKESSSLRRYALPYKKDIERPKWTISSDEQMLKALKSLDIVLGGDFHAFPQAQRSHLRLLRSLSAHKKLILAVECVPSAQQAVLDDYMSNLLNEKEFLRKVGWDKVWGFPWEQYKPLFEWLKKNKGRCVALNQIKNSVSYKSLVERDRHAAQIIAHAAKNKKTEELVYVIFGDLHIAREHLVKHIKTKWKTAQVGTVYLNPEKLYFQFYKKNQEHMSSIVQFSKNEFCLMESPPWVKWQSYLMYLNQNYDQFIEDDGTVDYSDHVQSLVQILSADLDLKVHDNFTVYSFNDLDFVEILKERLNRQEFSTLKTCVGNDFSFYLPQEKVAFLSRGTVNYSAHLSGLIVHAIVAGKKKWSVPSESTFELWIWQEAVAFFLSKLINPNRKAVRMDDLKKQLEAFSPNDKGEDALRLALDQKMQDLLIVYDSALAGVEKNKRAFHDAITYLKAAKILGAMMGEKIFIGYKAGHLSKAQIKKFLIQSVESDDFYNFYVQTLKTVDKIDLEPSLHRLKKKS